jgi:hypothetical protein
MRWLRAIIIFAIVASIVIAPAQPAMAATSVDIIITASGYVCGIPGGLTITYISDYEVGISWIKGEGAVNTMIRAKYGGVPTSTTDGYLVYYGDEENCSDTTMNFDEYVGKIYYSAWSENENGVFTQEYTSGEVEGISMQLLAFVLLCLGLTIGGYALKKTFIAMAAVGGWLVLLFYSYIQADGEWNVYMALFWVCLGMLLASIVEVALMRGKGEEEAEEEVEYTKAIDEAYKEMDEDISFRRSRRRGR